MQSGAINCGLNCFFSSCLIKAYVGHEKCWLVCVGLSANHLFNDSIILCPGGLLVEAEWVAGLADVYRLWLVSFCTDGQMYVTRLAWGITWTFACKTLQIEKSNDFKSSKYGSQTARVQNFQEQPGWPWWCGLALNPPEDVFSFSRHPMDP